MEEAVIEKNDFVIATRGDNRQTVTLINPQEYPPLKSDPENLHPFKGLMNSVMIDSVRDSSDPSKIITNVYTLGKHGPQQLKGYPALGVAQYLGTSGADEFTKTQKPHMAHQAVWKALCNGDLENINKAFSNDDPAKLALLGKDLIEASEHEHGKEGFEETGLFSRPLAEAVYKSVQLSRDFSTGNAVMGQQYRDIATALCESIKNNPR